MRFQRIVCAIWLVWFVFTAQVAGAHEMNLTAVKIRLESEGVGVSVVLHAHALTAKDPAKEIPRRLKLRLDGQPFKPQNASLIRDAANGMFIWQARGSQPASRVTLEAPLFPERAELATVLTLIRNGQVIDEALLNAEHPAATLGQGEPPASALQIFRQYLWQGVLHIWFGPDHVLFLVSLLVLLGGWRELLKIVTAFTLAHSVTLSLAVTGKVDLSPRVVEPLIALSLVIVAVLNWRGQGEQDTPQNLNWRPLVAFWFGLVHGFGFAGALAEVGLPPQFLAWALVAFNLGVELGQAALVLVLAPSLGALVKTWPRTRQPVVYLSSACVAAAGAFWFAQRLFSV